MKTVHFRNFLGPPGSSLCGGPVGPSAPLTLNPRDTTCERCLALLGRLRDANIAAPGTAKPNTGL